MDQSHATEFFRALSVPNRVHILMLLKSEGPLPVKEIAERLEMTAPAVSQHLKVLRHVGLVHAERQGYFVPYSVDHGGLNDCCGMMIRVCGGHACHHGSVRAHDGAASPEGLRRRRDELLAELHRIEIALAGLSEEER